MLFGTPADKITDEFLYWARYEKAKPVSLQTLATYKKVLKIMRVYWADRRLEAITVDEIKHLRTNMLKRGLTSSYIQTYLCVLRSFFRYCRFERGLNTIEPKDIQVPAREKKQIDYLTIDELKRFLAVIKIDTICGLRFKAFVAITLDAGTRISETVSLDRQFVDLGEPDVVVTGKGNKQRRVFFTAWSMSWAKCYLRQRTDKSEALFVSHNPEYEGTRSVPEDIRRYFRRYSKLAGLKRVTPHTLRRTAATHWRFNGASIETIMHLLGHEDIRVTQRYVGVDWKFNQLEHSRHSMFGKLDFKAKSLAIRK